MPNDPSGTVRTASSDALILVDDHDRVVEATRQACDLTGYTREDLLFRPFHELATSSEALEASRLLARLHEEATIAFEAVLRVKDGSAQRFHLRLSRLSVSGRRHSLVRVARRRRAADRLADDPEFARVLLDASETLLFVLDDRGRFAYANRSCEAALGLSFPHLRGKTVWELVADPAERERMKVAVERLDRGTFPARMAHEWTIREGATVRVAWSSKLMHRPDGSVRYVIGTGDEAAPEGEERFRRLAENAEDVIYGYRLLPTPGYEYVSPSVLRVTGYAADEYYRDPDLWIRVIYPDDRPLVEEILRTGQVPEAPFPLRWITRDGRELWMEHRSIAVKDASGRTVAIDGIARDITDRRRAQRCQEVLHAGTRILAGADSLSAAAPGILREIGECLGWQAGSLWLVDREAEVLRMAAGWRSGPAPGAEDVARRSALRRGVDLAGRVWEAGKPLWITDLTGQPGLLMSPGADREGLRAAFAFPFCAANEVLGVLEFLSREVRPPDAQMFAMIGSLGSQISQFIERKDVEAEVRRLNEGLERRVQERTAQLEVAVREMALFTYTIAHDLRAPLRSMSGFAQAMVEDFGPHLDPICLDYARRVAGSARKMDALIVDLLSYGRLIHLQVHLEPVSLEGTVRMVLERMRSELSACGAVVEVARPMPQVVANATMLDQVVSHLLSNAIKFVASGVAPRVSIDWDRRGDRVRLWVRDNGIGIDPEFHERIFWVFQRLNREEEYPGTGMGLAIVRKALDRMGGRSGVESARGQGSRFWIELLAAD